MISDACVTDGMWPAAGRWTCLECGIMDARRFTICCVGSGDFPPENSNVGTMSRRAATGYARFVEDRREIAGKLGDALQQGHLPVR